MITLCAILYITLWPTPVGADEVNLFPGADKLVHAIMMGGLLSAVLFDHRRAQRIISSIYIFKVGFWCVVFSAFDEIAQHVMNLGRSWSFSDFLSDVAGIVIASFLAPPVINSIFRKDGAANKN